MAIALAGCEGKEEKPSPKSYIVGSVYCLGNYEVVATSKTRWYSSIDNWVYKFVSDVDPSGTYYSEAMIRECSQ